MTRCVGVSARIFFRRGTGFFVLDKNIKIGRIKVLLVLI